MKMIGKDPEHPPAPGRYHLFVSGACPWASRCRTMRAMLGLEDAIGVQEYPTCLDLVLRVGPGE